MADNKPTNKIDDELNLDVNQSLKRKLLIKLVVVAVLILGGGASMIYTYAVRQGQNKQEAKAAAAKSLEEVEVPEEFDAETMVGEERKEDVPEGEGGKSARLGKAQYYSVEPAFIVKLLSEDGLRHYLQFEVTIMTRDRRLFMQLKEHDPLIKSEILRITSGQYYEDLITLEGRESFKEALLKTLRLKLKDLTRSDQVDDILFTKFIME